MGKRSEQPSRHAAKPPKAARPTKPKRFSRGVRATVMALSVVMTVVALLAMSAGVYVWILVDKVNFEGETSEQHVDELPDDGTDDVVSGEQMDNPDDHAVSVSDIQVKGNTKDITNILLLGIDGNSFVGRSDTTMLLSINNKTKKIRLISFLRDTWVTIPGRDKNGDGKDDYVKLNAAYAYGGFDLLSKTMEQNFRLKVDKYVAVNFKAFPAAVNAMGGVTMTLTAGEARIVGVGGGRAGTYHLNGTQTLDYARIRKLDSDFGRTNRQRKVVTALLNEAKKMDLLKLHNTLMDVLPKVKTNMSQNEFIAFTANVVTYASYTIEADYHLPQNGSYKGSKINGGLGLWLNDAKKSVKELHDYIYG